MTVAIALVTRWRKGGLIHAVATVPSISNNYWVKVLCERGLSRYISVWTLKMPDGKMLYYRLPSGQLSAQSLAVNCLQCLGSS